jgi:hypothetical protein
MSTRERALASDSIAGRGRLEALFETLLDALAKAGDQVVFSDPRDLGEIGQAEGLRYLTRSLAAGLVSELEFHDPAFPQFCKILSPWLNWGYPNPDGTYAFANLHGDYRYRIFGDRGTARLFDIEVWEGDIAQLAKARTFSGRRDIYGGKSEIEMSPDGEFEVILSRDQQPGNWVELPPGPCHLYVRQWYYDWENEIPGSFYIERIGATYPPAPPTVDDYLERFGLFVEFVSSVHAPLRRGIEEHYRAPADSVPFPDGLLGAEGGGEIAFRNQCYGRGRYECGPDDAVILEVEPPKAEYWMFGLVSHFWESYDWRGRQISINGHQAALDDDGMFRAVISHRDPGVPNWLDASCRTTGLIGGRYNWSENVPIPGLRTIRLEEVRRELPATTPVVTHEERQDILRRRLFSIRRRMVDW